MSKVSICVPAYKDADGIRRLMNSIRAQDFTDIDIVVSDDTPDDSVEKVLAEYEDLPIAYYHNDSPLGACGNWNKSIDLADGEYIKIMHQDDSFTFPDSLSKFVSMLDKDPDTVMAFSGSRQVTIKKDDPMDMSDYYDRCISEENLDNMRADYRDLYCGDWVGAPSATIFRRTQVRFDYALTWIIDVDFYIGLLEGGGKFEASLEPLVSIGVSDTQLTNRCIEDGELNIREYHHVMQKYHLQDNPKYRQRLCSIAVLYKQKYSSIDDLGITKEEYMREYKARKKYLRDFYIGLIKRKLTGKHA